MDSFLNIPTDTQKVLDEHYRNGHWDYLKSKPFIEHLHKPAAEMVNNVTDIGEFPDMCIDCGCGEALLGDYITCGYIGFDLSGVALDNAKKRNEKLWLYQCSLDNPPRCLAQVLIFGGVLEVSVKAERRIEFLEYYRGVYNCMYFLIYDLLRFDDVPIKRRYDLIEEFYVDIPPFDQLPETKLHRKVMLFKCQ